MKWPLVLYESSDGSCFARSFCSLAWKQQRAERTKLANEQTAQRTLSCCLLVRYSEQTFLSLSSLLCAGFIFVWGKKGGKSRVKQQFAAASATNRCLRATVFCCVRKIGANFGVFAHTQDKRKRKWELLEWVFGGVFFWIVALQHHKLFVSPFCCFELCARIQLVRLLVSVVCVREKRAKFVVFVHERREDEMKAHTQTRATCTKIISCWRAQWC